MTYEKLRPDLFAEIHLESRRAAFREIEAALKELRDGHDCASWRSAFDDALEWLERVRD